MFSRWWWPRQHSAELRHAVKLERNCMAQAMVLRYLQENIKSLVTHLVDEFYPQLEHVDYVETFRSLKLKYDQVRRPVLAARLCGLRAQYKHAQSLGFDGSPRP